MSDKAVQPVYGQEGVSLECGLWLNGQHIWTGTGKTGDEESLHNLVCSRVNDPQCINPKYKRTGMYENGRLLEKRSEFIEGWDPNAPKNQVSKEELKVRVLKLKNDVYNESSDVYRERRTLLNKYLNRVLDILEEYRT